MTAPAYAQALGSQALHSPAMVTQSFGSHGVSAHAMGGQVVRQMSLVGPPPNVVEPTAHPMYSGMASPQQFSAQGPTAHLGSGMPTFPFVASNGPQQAGLTPPAGLFGPQLPGQPNMSSCGPLSPQMLGPGQLC